MSIVCHSHTNGVIMDKELKTALNKTGVDVLKALAYIIDMDEHAKLHHSWRVAYIAHQLARRLCRESTMSLYIAGLLHDIATFDLSDRLVHHNEHMEDISNNAVRVHPQKSAAIVASLPGFIPIAKIILDHHEWYNGQGYPRGLSREQISIESQIIRMADKAAFILYTTPDCTKPLMYSLLTKRVDREFSKKLCTTFMGIIHHGDTWDTICRADMLERATNSLFSTIGANRDERPEDALEILKFFARVLDAKHSYTEGHSQRVAYFSAMLALGMGLSESNIRTVEMAAYLHDIRKIGIPVSIIDKTGALNEEEQAVIQRHAELSYNIVKDIALFKKLAHIVNADQEHWDGSGYPFGLRYREIPLEARIIFVADAFDAMTSDRSYRKAMPVSQALKRLQESAGTDFDPDVVAVAAYLFNGLENPSSSVSCRG